MRFVVIEGLDGSGKTTQINLIREHFEAKNIKSQFIHFPRMETGIYGELISRFLRGEMGDIDKVDPYLVALIYAGDRKDAADTLRKWMKEDYLILADRYLYSNIAFQCAKLDNWGEKAALSEWIKYLEYSYNNIPEPDLNLYLNVPFQFTQNSLTGNRAGEDRKYLKGNKDIHEADLSFQEKVKEIYLWQVEENEDFKMIDCSDEKGHMLPPHTISEVIISMIDNQ